MKAQMRSDEVWPDPTTDWGASCLFRQKKSPYTFNKKIVLPLFLS